MNNSHKTSSHYLFFFTILFALTLYSCSESDPEAQNTEEITGSSVSDTAAMDTTTIDSSKVNNSKFVFTPLDLNTLDQNEAEQFLAVIHYDTCLVAIEEELAYFEQGIAYSTTFVELQLHKIHSFEYMYVAILGTYNLSDVYNTYLIGFDLGCCWYETYLVNYTKEGEMIDFLLLEKDDYDESLPHISSVTTDTAIHRTEKVFTTETSEEFKVTATDVFSLNEEGYFIGDDQMTEFIQPNYDTVNLEGKWVRSNPKSYEGFDTIQLTREGIGVYEIEFDGETPATVQMDQLNMFEGDNFGGHYTLQFNYYDPTSIWMYYTDDGRDEFEPIINETYERVDY